MPVALHALQLWQPEMPADIVKYILTILKVKVSQSCLTLCDPMDFSRPWNFPGQNTGVGGLSLLQEIFPTQGSNSGLPHCRRILYQLSHKGSPKILEWVAYPISSRSSQPRDRTQVSCIAGGFFTNRDIFTFTKMHLGPLSYFIQSCVRKARILCSQSTVKVIEDQEGEKRAQVKQWVGGTAMATVQIHRPNSMTSDGSIEWCLVNV